MCWYCFLSVLYSRFESLVKRVSFQFVALLHLDIYRRKEFYIIQLFIHISITLSLSLWYCSYVIQWICSICYVSELFLCSSNYILLLTFSSIYSLCNHNKTLRQIHVAWDDSCCLEYMCSYWLFLIHIQCAFLSI